MPFEDKRLFVGLFHNTTLTLYINSHFTTRMRGLNQLWEVFLTKKADFSKLNILMLTSISYST